MQGSTTYAIKKALGIEGSFLGVDVVKDGKLVIKDANEEQLLDFLSKNKARIIVAPLSNGFICNGFIFGRGNQQISWRVIKKVGKNGIIVVATPQKLALLKKLRVDADEVNEILRGEMRVIIGFGLSQLMEVE
ncbi:MAG: hypothetical protein FE045_03685 [Thermoplasmata archaeon]|nr:MAG: hypothetical protein FE045_03685 [Thermoplasmata archaeon]